MTLARVIASFTRTRATLGNSPLSRALHLTRFVSSRARPVVATHDEGAPLRHGTIALFTGCLDPWLNPRVVEDAVWVIEAMGYRCVVPEGQGCCGALHQHAGDATGAEACTDANTTTFDRSHADRIVYLSTGCGMTLTTGGFSKTIAVEEICSWIERVLDDSRMSLSAVSGEVSVHRPCSAAHTGDDASAPARLLRRLPGLKVHAQEPGIGCCGAAGSYILEGEHSARLGQIAAATITPGSTPITPNLGCALQIAIHSGLSEPALHPVSVLRLAMDGGGSIA